MNTLDSKSLPALALSGIKTESFSRVFNKLISVFKRKPVATKPADFEVDNLDWYRTFKIQK